LEELKCSQTDQEKRGEAMGIQKELVITTHVLEKAADLFCYMGWLLL